jgi:NTE family protein
MNLIYLPMRWAMYLLMAAVLAGTTACSTTRPWVNAPLAGGIVTANPDEAASLREASEDDFSIIAAVTLSGGGARAAAFGYGVLQALRKTPVLLNGRKTSLLDQVGVISGVSGGSIVATYYAAFGAENLERFESDFLRQNFQDSLINFALKPGNLVNLSSPWFGRTQLLAQRLDELYQGKTYADMWARPGRPRLLVSSTDLSLGSSFEFSWDQFTRICSDLGSVPLSFAVASSSAVPMVLSPVAVKNYAGSCTQPASVAASTRGDGPSDYRSRMLRTQLRSYEDAKARPFIHLVDGGVSDNLGVRSLLDGTLSIGGIRSATRNLPKGVVRKLVLVTVNAERDPVERIDDSDKVPSTLQVVDAMLFGAGARATQETLGLLGDVAQQWKREIALAAQDGQSAFAKDAQVYVITVNLRDAPEAVERTRLLQVPTAFSIAGDDVTRLIQAGHEVLHASARFKELVQSLQLVGADTGGEQPQ